MRENKLNAVSFLLATSATICLPEILNLQEGMLGFTYSILSFFIWLFNIFILKYAFYKIDRQDRRGLALSGVFAFFFAGAMLFGARLEAEQKVDFSSPGLWISWLILTCFFGVVVRCAFNLLEEHAGRETNKNDSVRYETVLTFFFILLCWLPVFLAVYPGFFVYDADNAFEQVSALREFSTHHPLVHVLLLGGMIRVMHRLTGSYNLGIAAYIVPQMIFASGVFSGVLAYLKKRGGGGSGRLRLMAVLYYAFFPVIIMFALCSTKDGIFTLSLLVMLVSMLHMGYDPESFFHSKKSVICFLISTMLMLLFRKNGIYIFVLFVPILLLWQKKYWKKLVPVIGVALIVNLGINTALAAVLHANTSERQELLAVPIQQLARTYVLHKEIFTEEDAGILHEFLSEDRLQEYSPKLSDFVKDGFDSEVYSADPSEFWRLWARIGLRNPSSYVNAWLMTSYGFWYPDTVIDVYKGISVRTFTYQDSSYFGYEVEFPGQRMSKIPWLDEWYRKLSLEIYKEKVPAISMFFSPGFMFWFFALVTWYLWYRRRYAVLIPNLLIWFLYLTHLVGPTFLPRYVLIFWFGLPVFAAMLREEI